jgi:hypothetical protein
VFEFVRGGRVNAAVCFDGSNKKKKNPTASRDTSKQCKGTKTEKRSRNKETV